MEDTGLLKRLLELLSFPEAKVQDAAIEALGHFLHGTDSQKQAVVAASSLEAMSVLLTYKEERMSFPAFCFLVDVCGGNSATIRPAVDAMTFHLIIRRMKEVRFLYFLFKISHVITLRKVLSRNIECPFFILTQL
jgi:hypothetical protein